MRNDDGTFWHYDSNIIAKFRSGSLDFYFIDDEYKENTEDLFLLDYTISFGCWDRPGPILRFLRIVAMRPPMNALAFQSKIQEIEAHTNIQQGLARSRVMPQMRVLSTDESTQFRPYLEVRGTAIPIYYPLNDLRSTLNGAYGKSDAFPRNLTPMQKLDLALDLMTANGWSEHIQGSKQASGEQEEKVLDAAQHKPNTEDAAGGKQTSIAQASNRDSGRFTRFLSRFRLSQTNKDGNAVSASGLGKTAPDLNDVE